MAPEDRRAALIAATLPLLREHGVLVTTKQIAEAAGVAEGTIFGVFRDKPTLIREAVLAAFDPAPMERAMSAIDPDQDLRGRLTDAARMLSRGFNENGKLIGLMRTSAKDHDDPTELFRRMGEARMRTFGAVAKLIEPDEDLLRVSPDAAARLLVSIIFASGRHGFGPPGMPGDPLSLDPDQVVSLLLDGLLTPNASETTTNATTGETA